jgi:hypothetical protein
MRTGTVSASAICAARYRRAPATISKPFSVSGLTLWIIFTLGVIFAAGWTWRKTYEKGKPLPYIQTAVSTVAFFVWAYATGGHLPQWPGTIYDERTATLLLVGFTLLSGLVTKP